MQSKEFYPSVFGNEEEKGMLNNFSGSPDEPYDLAAHLDDYIPDGFSYVDTFLSNGYRLYAQGSIDGNLPTNVELATPECEDIDQLVESIRGGDIFTERLSATYAQKISEQTGRAITFRLQKRVVDSSGSTKGCHDNFGYQEPIEIDEKAALRDHLATRSFVTGAGYIDDDGAHFSQKVPSLQYVEQYGFVSSMFRTDQEHGGERLEVRSNDPNISDWATKIRIGSVALSIALSRADLLQPFHYAQIDTLQYAQLANRTHIDIEGNIKPTDFLIQAVDYQQRIAELAMDKLQLFTELPTDYFMAARELYDYCDDFKAYMNGYADISLLADRADWAAKFSTIRRYYKKAGQFDLDKSISSMQARIKDMEYDNTTITAGEDGPKIEYGKGYVLRDRGVFRHTVSKDAAMHAYFNAPRNTRAHIRAQLIKEGWITGDCSWERFDAWHEDDFVEINIDDPLQNDLGETQRWEIKKLLDK